MVCMTPPCARERHGNPPITSLIALAKSVCGSRAINVCSNVRFCGYGTSVTGCAAGTLVF